MISRYMGPHYGNNVVLPGAGTYHLSLLVSPPVSARHIEYQDVWLTPHRVNFTFHWNAERHNGSPMVTPKLAWLTRRRFLIGAGAAVGVGAAVGAGVGIDGALGASATAAPERARR